MKIEQRVEGLEERESAAVVWVEHEHELFSLISLCQEARDEGWQPVFPASSSRTDTGD